MDLARLEAMLAQGKDSALLRYSLGLEHLKQGSLDPALEHLERALAQDPAYSAAWKQYGNALARAGRLESAAAAYAKGIEVAEARGDVQAAREMGVLRRRLEKRRAAAARDDRQGEGP